MRRLHLALIALFSLSFTACASAPSLEPESGEKWNLVWADEFDGEELNLSKWSYEENCWGGGNEERQCYTVNANNLSLADGNLIITALKEESSGSAFPEHMQDNAERRDAQKSQPFTSARIRTLGKGDWRYGRIDVRAKLPGGQGVWPAIWMLPTDNVYGGWAASGEIDIMEAVNLGTKCEECWSGIENEVHGTLHYGDAWPGNAYKGDKTQLTGDIEAFYTYSIVWREGEIRWYLDGKEYARLSSDDWHTNSKLAQDRPRAPFDQKFHIILNLAIGGKWPESENDMGYSAEGFPKRMLVDYVRVYECTDDPAKGSKCKSL